MVRPAGDGVPLLIASIFLLALCWPTFIARIGVRKWRQALGVDDLLMLIGLLLFTVTSSLCIVCTHYGSGQLSAFLKPSDIMRGIKLFFIAEFFYASGAVAIKCSIAVNLLRIADTRRGFVWSIWAIMISTILSVVIFIIAVANICHPITTLWGETTTGSCNLSMNADVGFFFSAIEITTDWALAVMPAVLLWNLQMKKKIKISVAENLGLAAVASCATIVRLRYLSLYSDPKEFLFGTGKIGFWSILEEGIGIFAGSLPALRPVLSHGFFSRGRSNANSGPSASSRFKQPSVEMSNFEQLKDKEVVGDADSQKHILKKTQITVQANNKSYEPREWEQSRGQEWK